MKKPLTELSLNGVKYAFIVSAYWFIAALTFPVLTNFLLSLELAPYEVGLAFSCGSLFYFFFDVPLGFLGDRLPKRVLYSSGLLVQGLTFTVLAFFHTRIAIYFAFSIYGIGRALSSGVLEAWLVNSLKRDTRRHQTEKAFRLASLGSSLAIASSVAFVALKLDKSLAEESVFFLNLAASLMFLLALIAFTQITDGPLLESNKDSQTKKSSWLDSWQEVSSLVKTRTFNRFLSLTTGYGLAFGFFETFWMPIGKGLTLTESKVSWAYSMAYVASAVLLLAQHLLPQAKNGNLWITTYRLLFSISFLFMAASNNFVSFLMAIVTIYVLSFLEAPLIQSELNHHISDRNRTLLLSLDSSVKQGVGICSGLVGALMFQKLGAAVSLSAISAILLFTLLPQWTHTRTQR